MKWTNVICISNIQTAKSCPIEARVVPKEMLIVKDTAALKNGDEVVTSSQIVKVKITKNVPKSFVTIATVFVQILGTVMVGIVMFCSKYC